MKKIFITQTVIFLILCILSLIFLGNIWMPVLTIISVFIGPIMAFEYPYPPQEHLIMAIVFTVSAVLMIYGFVNRASRKGVAAFTIGFWVWAFLGLLAGTSTGT